MNTEEIIKKAEASLEKIRPFLKKDGGDVKIVNLAADGSLTLEFLGNCSTCSMSNMTFKNGIEDNIKKDVPEISKVIAVNLAEEFIN